MLCMTRVENNLNQTEYLFVKCASATQSQLDYPQCDYVLCSSSAGVTVSMT